jgi:RimJ/RimL family protein N-acetyltransferase
MTTLLPSRIIDHDLTIQRWTATDVDPMEALVTENLDHLRPWMAWAAHEPITSQQRRQLFSRWDRYWKADKGAVYSVRVDDELVGGCAIHLQTSDGAEIGYWLGHNATGRGIATRTARALTDEAFRLDDIDFVQISHEHSNTRSGAVAERLGYTRVPTLSPGDTRWRVDRSRWFSRRDNESVPRSERRCG